MKLKRPFCLYSLKNSYESPGKSTAKESDTSDKSDSIKIGIRIESKKE